MNKVKIKGKVFNLKGDIIKKGAKLNFKAINRQNQEISLLDVQGMKIISVFPDINTSVCDKQTVEIAKLAKQFSELKFISITQDDVATINKWCAGHGLENVDIWSDKKYNEFGNKTNTLIVDIDKLARGFLILNGENEIIDLAFNEEVAQMPNFDLVKKYLK